MHFIYDEIIDKRLLQGDIISRSDQVESILKEIHPHYYHNKDYKYFIVLTQTCDLVIRNNGKTNSRYITIAAVRPIQLVLQREAEKLLYNDIDKKLGICDEKRKAKLVQFTERLLNNNESDYFFLGSQNGTVFTQDHCAFLRLSIALKSEKHYETLLNSKILQLKETFQHKLGYLTGNTYSRVGTEDWVPSTLTLKEFNKKVDEHVKTVGSINFLPSKVYKYVIDNAKSLHPDEVTFDLLEQLYQEKKQEKSKKKKELADIVVGIMKEIDIEPQKVKMAKNRIINDTQIGAFIK